MTSTAELNRLSPGDAAPNFVLRDESGETVSLSDFAGKKFVLYTYPQAFTPGCTSEACDFRDNDARIIAAGYEVIGISADPIEKLADFRAEHELPFRLLSDPDYSVQKAYGAYGEKNRYGKVSVGAIRSTFIIDEHGKIADALYNVRASGHVERVLKKLEAL